MKFMALVPDAFGGYGGISVYNRDMLRAICSYPGVDEVVALPRLVPDPVEPLPDKLTFDVSGKAGKVSYFLSLLRQLTGKRYQLIVCGHINLLPLAVLAKMVNRCPLLLEIYGIEAWSANGGGLIKWALRKVDGFSTISAITGERFLSWSGLSPEQQFRLPNAIWADQFGIRPKNQALAEKFCLNGKRVLMTFGRLVSEDRAKGFDEVFALLSKLNERIGNLAYLIVGTGPDQERLQNKANELGVEALVVFAGYIDEEDKTDIYNLADVYVMPSRGEGFGFVFLEAMACGVPVIASSADGGREAVREGELGLLVNPDSPDEIEAAIIKCLEMEKEVPEGLAYFSFENFSIRMHQIVSTLVEGASR